jgi:hypothetical protein
MAAALKEGRQVYCSNLNGIKLPGVMPLEDPRNWEDLPPGSLLVVDEAQKFWRTRRSGDPPPEVQAMETQRHTGISMLLMTQQPNYLDKHLRGLIDRHEHLVRKMGAEASFVYAWERVHEEPLSPSSLEAADQTLWVFPKNHYADYDSAEVHTVKKRIPTRLKIIGAAVVVIGALLWYAMRGLGETQPPPGHEESGASVAAALSVPAGPITPDQYLEQFRPRFERYPASAPAYDGRKVQAEPRIFCMIGQRKGCQCMTEQATVYPISRFECVKLAREGAPYDPFKRPAREPAQRRERAENDTGAAGAAQTAPVGAGIVGEAQAAYGAFRSETAASAPADQL